VTRPSLNARSVQRVQQLLTEYRGLPLTARDVIEETGLSKHQARVVLHLLRDAGRARAWEWWDGSSDTRPTTLYAAPDPS
jgi:hypothetical protein